MNVLITGLINKSSRWGQFPELQEVSEVSREEREKVMLIQHNHQDDKCLNIRIEDQEEQIEPLPTAFLCFSSQSKKTLLFNLLCLLLESSAHLFNISHLILISIHSHSFMLYDCQYWVMREMHFLLALETETQHHCHVHSLSLLRQIVSKHSVHFLSREVEKLLGHRKNFLYLNKETCFLKRVASLRKYKCKKSKWIHLWFTRRLWSDDWLIHWQQRKGFSERKRDFFHNCQ